MPDFDAAVGEMPIQDLFAKIADDGRRIGELLAELEEEGKSRQAILQVLQSQLDAGTVRLTHDMTLERVQTEAAA